MTPYSEAPEAGYRYRQAILEQIQGVIQRRRDESRHRRARYFRPVYTSVEAYQASLAKYRRRLRAMLGWPLTLAEPARPPAAREQLIATDDLGSIYRVWIETLAGLETYGLLFTPSGSGPHPLVLALHGGSGTPELCAGFFGSANYNDMVQRTRQRGFAVFAPQLPMWHEQFGPALDRVQLDVQFKQLGGSLTAFNVWQLQRSLDHLVIRSDINGERIAILGLSWGSFYALVTAALEPRIHATLASGFFSDRYIYDRPNAVWFDSGNRFLDTEIAAMVCPRPLYIEVGQADELFDVQFARVEAQQVATHYVRLGIAERFCYQEHPGCHEFARDDEGLAFLSAQLRA